MFYSFIINVNAMINLIYHQSIMLLIIFSKLNLSYHFLIFLFLRITGREFNVFYKSPGYLSYQIKYLN